MREGRGGLASRETRRTSGGEARKDKERGEVSVGRGVMEGMGEMGKERGGGEGGEYGG